MGGLYAQYLLKLDSYLNDPDGPHVLLICWPTLEWLMLDSEFDRFPYAVSSWCFQEIAHVYQWKKIRNEFVGMIDKCYSFFSPNLWAIICVRNSTIKEA